MEFKEYQRLAWRTASYPRAGQGSQGSIEPLMYPLLGIAGESGEICEKVKKAWRNNGYLTDEMLEGVRKEIGDVFWYLAALSTELHMSLDEIAQENIEKLADRAERGVLKSEGDMR
jgi:NTP pyrophosphatase (non-canonical NTP hydrolase)